MNANELRQDLERSSTEADALQKLWEYLIGAAPAGRQFHTWLYRYGYEATKKAVERTSVKFSQLKGEMDAEYQVRYCSVCAKRNKETADTKDIVI